MNNKGFGLPEVLLFVGISMFVLIIIAIYINNNIINNSDIFPKKIEVKSTNYTLVPNNFNIPKEYQTLENKLKKASKKYKFNKKENVIISLNKLKKAGLISKLTDPNDKNILCNGYVIYNSELKEYKPYINCNGMYSTNNYNNEFE
ncbi:MAG: hypothetical protein E7157_02815 [Lactobacillales bacterium]|nr:hypothetical protein [Lactobacillales bacterium]